jgi:hypothetical protein
MFGWLVWFGLIVCLFGWFGWMDGWMDGLLLYFVKYLLYLSSLTPRGHFL